MVKLGVKTTTFSENFTLLNKRFVISCRILELLLRERYGAASFFSLAGMNYAT